MLLHSLINWSKRSPAALFACQGRRANAHLDRRWLYLRSKGLTEGTVPPHGPFLTPVYPGQHQAPLRPPCRSSPGLPCGKHVRRQVFVNTVHATGRGESGLQGRWWLLPVQGEGQDLPPSFYAVCSVHQYTEMHRWLRLSTAVLKHFDYRLWLSPRERRKKINIYGVSQSSGPCWQTSPEHPLLGKALGVLLWAV